MFLCCACGFFFFKQKTAYEMRISDWSSDGCSSDLKETLYRAVVTGILDVWLSALGEIAVDDDPAEALSGYVRRKMALSRERPEASRVFAKIGRASCRARVCQYV